jgi:hypothetical protein
MARAAGRGIETCPLFAMGAMGMAWQREWKAGWQERDQSIRGTK